MNRAAKTPNLQDVQGMVKKHPPIPHLDVVTMALQNIMRLMEVLSGKNVALI